jgi:hypothetical protein
MKVLGVESGFAFVEGSPTGLPMIELTVVDPPAVTIKSPQPPTNPFFKPKTDEPAAGSSLECMTLDEVPVKLEWPADLSAESVERARRKAGVALKDEGK